MKTQFEEANYYLGRLLDHATLKALISFIGSSLTILFGEVTAPMIGFLFLLAADYVTGVAKSCRKGTLSSCFSRRGWGKIASYALVIFMGHMIQKVGIPGMRDFVLLWAGTTEAISVLENFDELGVQIPGFIKEKLLQTKEKKFGDKA